MKIIYFPKKPKRGGIPAILKRDTTVKTKI